MPHHPWAGEVTCPSLQSMEPVPFDTYYFCSSVARDFAVRTPDETHDNPAGTDQPDISCAIASAPLGSFSDISGSSGIVPFSIFASWLVGSDLGNNTFASSSIGDYVAGFCHSAGK